MQFGITFRIGAFATLLVIITAACIGFILYLGAERIITEHELVDLSDETRLRGAALVGVIDTLREDVLYLAGLNEIDALVRARMRGEFKPGTSELFDPVSRRTQSELRASLQKKFKEVCLLPAPIGAATNETADTLQDSPSGARQMHYEGTAGKFKPYFQVRFIGKLPLDKSGDERLYEEGREIVRVFRTPDELPDFGTPVVRLEHVPDGTLDERREPGASKYREYVKANEPYFQTPQADAAAGKKNSAIYLSAVNLNREEGKIKSRRMQVLRAFASVYDANDEFFGIVVINLDFATATRTMRNNPRTLEYVLDENQGFLVHPDPDYAFLWDHNEKEAHPD